jgi:hypothetical protein
MLEPCGGFIDKYGYPFCRGRIFDTVELMTGQYDYQKRYSGQQVLAMMIRSPKIIGRVVVLTVVSLPTMKRLIYVGDSVLRGSKIYCIPESDVYHVGGGTLPKGNPMKTYLNFRNNLTMLYKNLPDNELKHVMRVRWFLDYLAAFETLILNRNFADFKAIFKARRAFKNWIDDFASDREDIKLSTNVDEIPERCSFPYYGNIISMEKKFSRIYFVIIRMSNHEL